jgi:hypothetical protein
MLRAAACLRASPATGSFRGGRIQLSLDVTRRHRLIPTAGSRGVRNPDSLKHSVPRRHEQVRRPGVVVDFGALVPLVQYGRAPQKYRAPLSIRMADGGARGPLQRGAPAASWPWEAGLVS